MLSVLQFQFGFKITESLRSHLSSVPVSFVHQVGQIELTLLCEWAEVFVMLEKVQKLRGVGHPEGESARDGLLPL